jgi:enoyl-CoA hydratase
MLESIRHKLAAFERDEEVKVIIITGEKNFSAGADIKELKEKGPEKAKAFSELGHKICNQIEHMGKPVIAAVRGHVLGAGCEIALACDMRIAGESSKVGQPETDLGLIPGFGGTQRLPRLIGLGKAKEMIFTGRIIDAKEAASMGLINKVVKDEDLLKHTEEMAQLMAQKSPSTVRMAKELINREHGTKEGLEQEIVSFSECFATQDHLEGINAFLEKRKPKFKGV